MSNYSIGPYGYKSNVDPYSPTNASQGYIGGDPVNGFRACFRTPSMNASSTSSVSTPIADFYHDGHWGGSHYAEFLVVNTYYGAGLKRYRFNTSRGPGTQLLEIESIGSENSGTLSVATTVVGSGTHEGQSVWKSRITYNSNATYIQSHVIIKIGSFEHSFQVYGNDTDATALEANRVTAGGCIHLLNTSANGFLYKKTL